MTDPSIPNLVKTTVEKLLELMGFEGETVVSFEGGAVHVMVEVNEPELLIGYRGQNLASFKRIAQLMIIKKLPIDTPLILDLDVNHYREKANVMLREIARKIAERVVKEKRPLMLKPMSSYERRIIHLELASYADVITESIGEEPERRLVVKPYP